MQDFNENILSIGGRISQIIDSQCGSKYKFSRETGISEVVLHNITSGKNKPSLDVLAKILNKYLTIDANWLVSGLGCMSKPDEKTIVASLVRTQQDDPVGFAKIPLVNIFAVGGFGNAEFSIQSSDVKDYYVVPKFNDRKIDFMIEVSGSSMYPKYNSGDVIACSILRESKFIQWGKVHVLGTVEQGIIIKRLFSCSDKNRDCVECRSDNPNYPPFEVSHQEITGIAIVVGVIRLE